MFWCPQLILSSISVRVVTLLILCVLFFKIENMEFSTLMSTLIGHVLEFVASTSIGQFAIKKVDSMIWTLEQPAIYCVDGESSGYKRKLSWLVFWTVVINIQIFRVVSSTVLVRFNKSPIEPKDIVVRLQKWRRYLRSIRFRGLRQIRESKNANGNGVSSSPIREQSSKKRNHDEMLDYDLLEELVNETYSDNDDLDSTFTISRYGDPSMNCSSNNEQSFSDNNLSPVQPKNGLTDPTDSFNLNSTDATFESTTDESAFMMTRQDSTSSLTEESRTKFESSGKLYIGSTAESNQNEQCCSVESGLGSSKKSIGKESLNEPSDAADAVITKLVQMQKEGKTNFRINGKFQQGNKKNSKSHNDVKLAGVTKRKNPVRTTFEIVNRQQHVNDTNNGQEMNEKKE